MEKNEPITAYQQLTTGPGTQDAVSPGPDELQLPSPSPEKSVVFLPSSSLCEHVCLTCWPLSDFSLSNLLLGRKVCNHLRRSDSKTQRYEPRDLTLNLPEGPKVPHFKGSPFLERVMGRSLLDSEWVDPSPRPGPRSPLRGLEQGVFPLCVLIFLRCKIKRALGCESQITQVPKGRRRNSSDRATRTCEPGWTRSWPTSSNLPAPEAPRIHGCFCCMCWSPDCPRTPQRLCPAEPLPDSTRVHCPPGSHSQGYVSPHSNYPFPGQYRISFLYLLICCLSLDQKCNLQRNLFLFCYPQEPG